MSIKLLFSIIIFFSFQASAQLYPMIQTHKFEMEPYLKKSEGYAFFLSSPQFNGAEKVTVYAPENTLLPDIQSNSRVLNQYSGRQWYISDQDRVLSAQAGAVSEGVFKFVVENGDNNYFVEFNHKNYFLNPTTDIKLNRTEKSIDVVWTADPQANTFWIFVFPENTKNILNDLISVSSVMHVGNQHSFVPFDLKPGVYKIAIRSQKLWEGGTFWGVQAETWSISSESFIAL